MSKQDRNFDYQDALETNRADLHLCVVREVMRFPKYVGSRNQKKFVAGLKHVCRSAAKDLTELKLGFLEGEKNLPCWYSLTFSYSLMAIKLNKAD